MKVYNDNIKPEFTSFGKVAIGDTFCVNNQYVYIKTAHASDNEYNNQSLGFAKNCIYLTNGSITGFSDDTPVVLVDCELKWKFRNMKKQM